MYALPFPRDGVFHHSAILSPTEDLVPGILDQLHKNVSRKKKKS